jgi:hypothetical protein
MYLRVAECSVLGGEQYYVQDSLQRDATPQPKMSLENQDCMMQALSTAPHAAS